MAFQQQSVPVLQISCQENKMEFIPTGHAGKRIFWVIFLKDDYCGTSLSVPSVPAVDSESKA